MNRRNFNIIKLVCLIVCLALPTIYYTAVATDKYVSTAKFSVRGNKVVALDGILSLLGGAASGSSIDSHLVVSYIESLDMLTILDKKLDLRSHYSDERWDFVSRLPKNASNEQFLGYWHNILHVSYDIQTSVIMVDAFAYTPEMAQQIAVAVLEASEEYMNKVNDRIEADTIRQAHMELESAEKRYAESRKALNSFRASSSEIDPSTTAAARISIIAGLESRISSLTVELNTKLQFLSSGSFQIRSLRRSIAELQDQLEQEKKKLTGNSGPEMLNLIERYEELSLEHEFARNLYISTLGAMEAARVKGESKTIYLEAFQSPALPDQAVYPERLLSVGLSIIVVCMGYALVLFIIAAVKEHIGV